MATLPGKPTADENFPSVLASMQELMLQLNLDETMKTKSLEYFEEFQSKDPYWTEDKLEYILRCSVLIAAKSTTLKTVSGDSTSEQSISVTHLLRGQQSLDMQVFIGRLKELCSILKLEARVKSQVTELIEKFAFALTFYNKFEDIWNRIQFADLSDPSKPLDNLKQVSWLIFIYAKISQVENSGDVVETACLLMGVFHLIVRYLPSTLSCALKEEDSLAQLCSMTSCNLEQARNAADHVELMMAEQKSAGTIRGNSLETLDGILSTVHLPYNISNLSNSYQEKLILDSFDERDFIIKEGKIGTPLKRKMHMTPFAKQGTTNPAKLNSHRMLSFEDRDISMATSLHDIKQASPSPMKYAMTPMTMAMEMNNWIQELVASQRVDAMPDALIELLGRFDPNPAEDILARVTSARESMVPVFQKYKIGTTSAIATSLLERTLEPGNSLLMTQLTSGSANGKNTKIDTIIKLYFKVLEELIKNEEMKLNSSNLATVLGNSSFHMALLACCVESVFFVHNISCVAFHEVLEMCSIDAFDFWKLINSYAQFDPKMPVPLKRHLRALEIKILSQLAWTSSGVVFATVKARITRGSDESSAHPSYDMFFRRVLSQTAHRIMEICDRVNLADPIREDIWSAIKYLLSEKTELLMNRHLDQLIICTIYSVCKLNQVSLTFNAIISVYSELYEDEWETVVKQVLYQGEEYVDIIKFYNYVYIATMKQFLIDIRKTPLQSTPRISTLSPVSKLKANLPSPMLQYSSLRTSPMMTPRTKRLFAVGESPSQFKTMPTITGTSSRKIQFDQEERRYTNRHSSLQQVIEESPSSNDSPSFSEEIKEQQIKFLL